MDESNWATTFTGNNKLLLAVLGVNIIQAWNLLLLQTNFTGSKLYLITKSTATIIAFCPG